MHHMTGKCHVSELCKANELKLRLSERRVKPLSFLNDDLKIVIVE